MCRCCHSMQTHQAAELRNNGSAAELHMSKTVGYFACCCLSASVFCKRCSSRHDREQTQFCLQPFEGTSACRGKETLLSNVSRDRYRRTAMWP